MTGFRCEFVLSAGLVWMAAACTNWEDDGDLEGIAPEDVDCPEEFDPALAEPKAAPAGFRVVGNRIEDSEGNDVVLRGVNRSGNEYQCSKTAGMF